MSKVDDLRPEGKSMDGVLAAAVTSVGIVREHNEDCHLADPDAGVFIVADGMGGHAAGEVASKLAVDRARAAWTSPTTAALARAWADGGDPESQRKLIAAVRGGVLDAHLAIVDEARRDDSRTGMGTTFTGFLIAGGHAVFAHAGDSRAYLVRDEIAIQLSEDHTVLARLAAAGMRGEPLAADPSRYQGVLTNALGIGDGSRIATFLLPLFHGDRLLLCSDGVYEYLTEAEVGEVMVSQPSPARAAQRYIDLALDRGGADNATAVVIKILEAGETKVPAARRQRDEAVLEASPLFSELTPQERLRALRITTPREYAEGRDVPAVALGDRVAYVILDGAVELPGGKQHRAGDVLFPQALVDGWSSADAARAITSVRLLVIRRDDFIELTEDDSDLGVKLFAALPKLLRG